MLRSFIVGALIATAGVASVVPASAQVGRNLPVSTSAPTITDVEYRHPYGGRRYYHRGHRGSPGIGIGAGLAAGAFIGGVLSAAAPPPVYGQPVYGDSVDDAPQPQGADAEDYCAARFKSYDPSSGTYLGYDGDRHPCP